MSSIQDNNENINELAQDIVDVEKRKIESNHSIEKSRIDYENKKLDKFAELEDKRLKILDNQTNKNRKFAYFILGSIVVIFFTMIILSYFRDEYMRFVYDIFKILLGGIVGFAIKTIIPKK